MGLETGKVGHWTVVLARVDEGLVWKGQFQMENSLKSLNVVRTRKKLSMYFYFLLINKKLVHIGVRDPKLRSPQPGERRESFIPAIVRGINQKI